MAQRDPVTGRPLVQPQLQTPQYQQPNDAWQGGQPGYHYPGQNGGDPTAQQHYQPAAPQAGPRTLPGGRAAPQLADYAPQFARYSGTPEPPPMQPAFAPEPYQPPRAQAAPQQSQQSWVTAPAAPPAGYHQIPAQPAADPHWPGDRVPYQNLTTGDPRTYDPQAYAAAAHGGGQQALEQQQAHYGHQAAPQQGYGDPQQGFAQPPQPGGYPQAGYQDPAFQGQYAQQAQAYDPRTGQPYPPADGYAQAGYAQDQGQGFAQHSTFDPGQPIAGPEAGFEPEYAEAPPRKRRGLLVAGALVCAVAVGGGLAFVYKTFGPSVRRGPPPMVAKGSAPTKVLPADPQGKRFDDTNRKVLGARLDDAGGSVTNASAPAGGPAPIVPGMIISMPPGQGSQQAAAEPSSSPSTRAVQTVPIGRDGNPIGGQQAVVTPRGVPGVQIDNVMNAPPVMRGGLPAAEPQAPPAATKPAPQRLASAGPAAPATDAGGDPAPVPKARLKPAVPKVKPTPAVGSANAAPPTGVGAGGAGGYVAVLSSQKDRAVALRIYADLAQKYPDQLGNRQPDVQEANLGDKGVFQRLVVGPPSSQQSARELCTQLKSAGYSSDCWVTKY